MHIMLFLYVAQLLYNDKCKFQQLTITFFAGVFYYLPNVNDFIVEVLIGSINSQVILDLVSCQY